MSLLFIDTETNGLPIMKNGNYTNPKKFKRYNDCRLIELNWVIMNVDRQKVKKSKNTINPENIEELKQILQSLYDDLKEYKIKKIVGYNILFHYHVIIAEAYRVRNGKLLGKLDVINHKPKTKPVCSMTMCMHYLDIKTMKYPKLDELFYMFFKKNKGTKLAKSVKCFYRIKTLKEDKPLAQKYQKKYLKYLKKLQHFKK